MNQHDFDFINQQHKLNVVKTSQKIASDGSSKRRPPLSAAKTSRPTTNDDDSFLRIVEKTSQIASHRELFELLQSKAIQCILPHQVLIAAWGDFEGPNLQYDVISAVPGLRTGLLNHCAIDRPLQAIYKRWLAHKQQPLLLDSTLDAGLAHSDCKCALHKFLQGVWSLLVHGVSNVRDGEVSLYLALHASPIVIGPSIECFRPQVDRLITQIDVAFRRIAPLQSLDAPADQELLSSLRSLTRREQEILVLVAEGKANVDISKLLSISVFTVKNHLKRIMKKLNVPNRTAAVAHYQQMKLKPRKQQTGEKMDLTA